MKSSHRTTSSYYSHTSSSLYFPPASFTKTFARLIVLIVLFAGIFHHINSVDGFYTGGVGLGFGGGAGLGFGGGGGGRFGGGGFGSRNIGSSFGRNGGSFGRYGGGGGTSFFSRPRWWILGAGTFGGRNRARANQTVAEPIDSTNHVPATIDELAGVVGIFYMVAWGMYFLHKLTFKPGQYGQSEYSMMHSLSFIAFSAFSIAAYHIPLHPPGKGSLDYDESVEPTEQDAWAAWFEPNATMFIKLGDSPLNYFDLGFCALGTLFTTFIILKDCAYTNGLLSINMLTKLATLGFSIIMLIAVGLGLNTESWKIPMILFAATSLGLNLLRYLGLVFIHEHCGLSVSPSAKSSFVPVSRSKCIWSNRLELFAGLLSIVFHILMVYNYEDVTIAHINIIPIGMAGAAVLFSFLFLVRLSLSTPRYDRYVIPPTCGDSFGDGVSCREMLKMK